jgi:hypothetical protein
MFQQQCNKKSAHNTLPYNKIQKRLASTQIARPKALAPGDVAGCGF